VAKSSYAQEVKMASRFVNKTVIVTGASEGVGAAAVRLFHQEGANVVLAARRQEMLDKQARALGNRALAVVADVTDRTQLANVMARTVEMFQGVDVLVNNAGFNCRGELAEIDIESLEQIVNVNLKAPIVMTKLTLPHLLASKGAVVNVASIAGMIPMPDEATYCATKFGLRGFSFSLAEELRDTGVTVSTVAPGPVETGFILTDLDEVPDYVFSQPMSTAEQMAGLILDCAADGRRERAIPKNSARLATLGFHLPLLTKLLRPLLSKKGARMKKRYLDWNK